MKLFVLIIILTVIIASCFFKKRTWENRYLILLIIGGVFLVSTLTLNYVTRNNNPKVVDYVWKKELNVLNTESTYKKIHKKYDIEADTTNLDSINKYVLPYRDNDDNYFAFIVDDYMSRAKYKTYITLSDSDTAYYSKKRVYYGRDDDGWVSSLSLPHIQTIRCLELPANEYAMIPDSLKMELPELFTL